MGDLNKKQEIINKFFNQMNYQEENESDLALDWNKNHTVFPYVGACKHGKLHATSETIYVYENLANLIETNYDKITLFEKKKKLIKILKNETDLICQLEMSHRVRKTRDTKRGIEMLIDAINFSMYYAPSKEIKEIHVHSCTSLIFIGFSFGQCLGSRVNILVELGAMPIMSVLVECAIKAGFNEDDFALRYTEKVYWKYDKIPIIIFNSADLDAACDSAIDAAWGNQGRVEWSADTLIIQEDIFEEFIAKLKCKLEKARISIPVPTINDEEDQHLNDIILVAKNKGIEVYQTQAGSKEDVCRPTLFIGNRVDEKNVIKNVLCNPRIPTLTCLAFRSNKEAIAIANNTVKPLAVSVWTENLSLANEISQNVRVGTVWVNCYGLFKPETCLDPLNVKLSGASPEIGKDSFFKSTLSTAIKAQKSWAKLGYQERLSKLQKVAIDLYKSELDQDTVWVNMLLHSTNSRLNVGNGHSAMVIDNIEIKSYKEPLGVAIITSKIEEEKIIELLLEGNGLISPYIGDSFKDLFKGLVHKIKEFPKEIGSIVEDIDDVFIFNDCCYKLKNVWTPVGETYF